MKNILGNILLTVVLALALPTVVVCAGEATPGNGSWLADEADSGGGEAVIVVQETDVLDSEGKEAYEVIEADVFTAKGDEPVISVIEVVEGEDAASLSPEENRTNQEKDLMRALALREDGNYAEAASILIDLAEHDFVDAAYWLGDSYYYGRGVEKDHVKAAKWFKVAARNGVKDAGDMLGIMYYYGRGVPQSLDLSVMWATGEVVSDEREAQVLKSGLREAPAKEAALLVGNDEGAAASAPAVIAKVEETAIEAVPAVEAPAVVKAPEAKVETKPAEEAVKPAATPAKPAEPEPLWKTNPGTAYHTKRGYYLAPNQALSGRRYAGDKAPAIMLEIIRPNNAAITIGRMNTSCPCTQLSTAKNSYAQGEPAYVEVRNVKATPLNGHVYELYVQLTRPVRETIRYDIYLKSEEMFD